MSNFTVTSVLTSNMCYSFCTLYTVSQKNIPDIFECNLKTKNVGDVF